MGWGQVFRGTGCGLQIMAQTAVNGVVAWIGKVALKKEGFLLKVLCLNEKGKIIFFVRNKKVLCMKEKEIAWNRSLTREEKVFPCRIQTPCN